MGWNSIMQLTIPGFYHFTKTEGYDAWLLTFSTMRGSIATSSFCSTMCIIRSNLLRDMQALCRGTRKGWIEWCYHTAPCTPCVQCHSPFSRSVYMQYISLHPVTTLRRSWTLTRTMRGLWSTLSLTELQWLYQVTCNHKDTLVYKVRIYDWCRLCLYWCILLWNPS